MTGGREGATVLRAAITADVAALTALDRLCFGARAWPETAWWEVVVEPEFSTLVLVAGRALAAAAVYLPDPCVTHLASLAVHPAWRGRGLGGRLLDEVLGRGRATGSRWVALEVDADQAVAIRLYRGRGFGPVRRFREDGVRRLEMVRRLSRQTPVVPPATGRGRDPLL